MKEQLTEVKNRVINVAHKVMEQFKQTGTISLHTILKSLHLGEGLKRL